MNLFKAVLNRDWMNEYILYMNNLDNNNNYDFILRPRQMLSVVLNSASEALP